VLKIRRLRRRHLVSRTRRRQVKTRLPAPVLHRRPTARDGDNKKSPGSPRNPGPRKYFLRRIFVNHFAKGTRNMFTHVNVLTREIIGAAIEVHRHLGPGLLESAYQQCLAKELQLRGIPYQSEWPLPLEYKGLRVNCGYRVDFLVADSVVIETKAVEAIAPVHEAQLLTYMRVGGWKVGLLINFNVLVLKTGIRRKVLDFRG